MRRVKLLFAILLLLCGMQVVRAQSVTSATVSLTINGTGFTQGAIVNAGGVACQTVFVNSSQLTANCPYPGAITVSNPLPPAPAITSATTAGGVVGTNFSYQITATNNPTSYGASALPAGLSVDTVGGLISGIPTAAATTNSTVSASNAGGTGTGTLIITIGPPLPPPPTITSATSASGTVGKAFSYQTTATNSPTSYSATGLPAGLAISTTSGLISGTPTASGTSSISLNAVNNGGVGHATLTLVVGAGAATRNVAGTKSYTDSSNNVWAPLPTTAMSGTQGTNWRASTCAASWVGAGLYGQQYVWLDPVGVVDTITIPLPQNSYTVNMYFADPCFNEPVGARVFKLAFNGTVIDPALDIVKEAGGAQKPLVKTGTITGSSLVVAITLLSGSNPVFAAIEVIPTTAPPAHNVALSWTASTSTGLVGYNVKRSTTNGSGYTQIGNTPTTPSNVVAYVDGTVQGGQTYYYVLTSLAPACPATICGESVSSAQVTAVVPSP